MAEMNLVDDGLAGILVHFVARLIDYLSAAQSARTRDLVNPLLIDGESNTSPSLIQY
jgi:hypothetical protein